MSRADAALDTDVDGVPDAADPFPCDPTRTAVVFIPSEFGRGTLLFEDNWPERGDLDFNDAVVAYHVALFQDGAGLTSGLRLTVTPRAIGAKIENGLALRLAMPRASATTVTRAVGARAASPLLARDDDANLVLDVSANLREAYPGLTGFINTQAEVPSVGDGESAVAHGAGLERCDTAGSAFGACEAVSCEPGYQLGAGRCVELGCVTPWGAPLAHGQGVSTYPAQQVPFGSTCEPYARTCALGVLEGEVTAVFEACTVAARGSLMAPGFAPLLDQEPNTQVTSETITVGGGFSGTRTVTLSGPGSPQISVNGGPFTAGPVQVRNSDTIALRVTTANFADSRIVNVQAIDAFGPIWTTDWIVSTRVAPDTTPDPFDLAFPGGPFNLGVSVVSNPITVAGINTPATASVPGCSLQVNGGPSALSAQVSAGDQLVVTCAAPAALADQRTVTLTIGTTPDSDTIRTRNPNGCGTESVTWGTSCSGTASAVAHASNAQVSGPNGSAAIFRCNDGALSFLSGSCFPVCQPNRARTCAISNGAGEEPCNASGTGFGPCTVTGCNAGFVQSGNGCVPATNPCIQTVNWWGSAACSTFVALSHGQATTVSSSNGNDGTASVSCNNGNLSVSGNGCNPPPPPPSGCSGTVSWSGEGSCAAYVSYASHGQTVSVSNTANSNSGGASFGCNNGTLSISSNGGCTLPRTTYHVSFVVLAPLNGAPLSGGGCFPGACNVGTVSLTAAEVHTYQCGHYSPQNCSCPNGYYCGAVPNAGTTTACMPGIPGDYTIQCTLSVGPYPVQAVIP